MAKMFYTLAEVCEKLGKTEAEVEAMVEAKEIQEFRDGERLVFKVEQVDLLAPTDDDLADMDLDLDGSGLSLDDSFGLGGSASGDIGLAESQSADPPVTDPEKSGPLSNHDDSGSVLGLGASASQSAPGMISDDLDLSAAMDAPSESSDASASVSAFDGPAMDGGETQLGEGLDDDLTLESVGSGSGLLDLTRESDDTSLGAELLEEVFSSDEEVDFPAASGLFEAAQDSGSDDEDAAPAPAAAPVGVPAAMVAAQQVDPAWSGLSTGMLVGGLVSLMGVFAMVAVEVMGSVSGIAPIIAEQLWIWVGSLAGGTILLGLVGWFIGNKSG